MEVESAGVEVKKSGLSDDAIKGNVGGVHSHEAGIGMLYTILDTPPWYECALLGFQHYLTMLGSTVLVPFLLVPAMGGTPEDLAQVIQTTFFISGICTLLQTTVGDRLPIVQGVSFAYLTPCFAIIANVKATGVWDDGPAGVNHERFLFTMRQLSGAVISSAVFVWFIGFSGLLGVVLHYISPITVAANIAIVGLSLYEVGFNGVSKCFALGVPMICLIILSSQYLRHFSIPLPLKLGRLRLFEMFPVLLAIIVTWIYGIIMTEAGAYNGASRGIQAACRTDQTSVLKHSPWLRFPYPGQFGWPIFNMPNTIVMLAGALSAMVESLGDYYAAARIAGAPVPPPGLISRAVTWQGICCMLTGFWGTGNGTTAYNENIGAMQITRVGSRRVIQVAAAIIVVVAIVGKFGGLFASMPQAMVSGLFCVMFSLIAGVGITQMQLADMNSPRNIFILGFGIYMGLSVPYYFNGHLSANGHGPVHTGNEGFDDIMNSIFSTAAAVSLIITMILDNTIKGTREERGLQVWQVLEDNTDWWTDPYMNKVYGLPLNMTIILEKQFGPVRRAVFRELRKLKFWKKRSTQSVTGHTQHDRSGTTLMGSVLPLFEPQGQGQTSVTPC
eukprot:jgi/Botrbrau1/12575/Bobra.0169s0108.1